MRTCSVLMVCLGNICRSPTAQAVLEKLAQSRGLDVRVDSAGTSGWHIGEPPDARSLSEAKARGYDMSAQRGRQVNANDFDHFDYILAMDGDNLANLQALRPAHFSGHLGLLLDFGKQQNYRDVPDPYHGGAAGFTLVVDLIEDAVDGLLNTISAPASEKL